jgi:hypothetical protein
MNVEYNRLVHTIYDENNQKAGVDFQYDKKIPTGSLSLTYKFFWQRQKRTSEAVALRILHEEHVLKDGTLELLGKAWIVPNSVVVKDITGTIIYQEGFDYVLIERNKYLEIQRIPGGQIIDKATVYIDYTSLQPGSYQYDVNFHHFSATVRLFQRLVELYYHLSYQDYHNLKTTEFLTLNYFTQNTVGVRLEYKFASGGIEYETYSSTVVPYRCFRYFFMLQGNVKNRLLYSLNGNVRDLEMLDDNTQQRFVDVSGRLNYFLSPSINIIVEMGYRKQIGEQIDLDLLIARAELLARIRQMSIRIGVETYKRDYLHEKTSLLGGFISIARTFNWNKR